MKNGKTTSEHKQKKQEISNANNHEKSEPN